MAPLWKPHPNEVYLGWITLLLKEAIKPLSSWELTFLGSLETHMAYGNKLSEIQAVKLENLYAAKTA